MAKTNKCIVSFLEKGGLCMPRKNDPASRRLPVLGWRIIKTSIAVFICLIIYLILGYSGADMPTEAAITAILCMQPYLRDS